MRETGGTSIDQADRRADTVFGSMQRGRDGNAVLGAKQEA